MVGVHNEQLEERVAPQEVASHGRRHWLDNLAWAWFVVTGLWAIVGLVQLRVATGLIALAGERRGRAITDMDHFGSLPALRAEFDAAELGLQHPFLWIIVLAFFALTGALIALGVTMSRRPRSGRVVGAMAGVWLFGVFVAFAHSETLSLIMWLSN